MHYVFTYNISICRDDEFKPQNSMVPTGQVEAAPLRSL